MITKVSRRTFLKGASVVGAASLAEPTVAASSSGGGGGEVLDASEAVDVTLDLNGNKRTLRVLPDASIATAVRDAGLTGTKLACEGGACGACTIHVDGRPRNGCLALAVELEGAHVTTIEGVATERLDGLHPVQRAFLEADALQCGFCTPGFVMSGIAFFDAWHAARRTGRPTDDDVVHALAGNLCRCGCHPAIIEAVAAACAGVPARHVGGTVPNDERAVARVDGVEKVTGRARYTFDVVLPNMLHAAVIRAQVPHATITRIDVARAKQMPGVAAVDLSAIEREGGAYGKLRYIGQPIGAVAADTEALARAAAAAVVVDVKELGFVIDPADAGKDGAALVWTDEEHDVAPNAAEAPKEPESLHRWRGNVRGPMVPDVLPPPFGTGTDDGTGKRIVDTSPVRAELTVHTAVQMHATLERHGCVASWDGDVLTLYAGTQATGMNAADLADRLALPRGKVRVIAEHVGGGFGSKSVMKPEHIAAAKLAMQTGRPVRLVFPLDDHLLVGGNRPGTSHAIRVGASHDGALQAAHHEGKAFCGVGVGQGVTGLTAGHYPWRARTLLDENVVTNTPPSCPFRAPGFPPNAFALEQAVDEVAHKTGKHALLLRGTGDDDDVRRRVYRYALEKAPRLGKVSESADGRFVRGVGVATAQWFVITSPGCSVQLRAHRTGEVEASTAIHDMGQGARTVLTSIVSDELGLDPAKVNVRIGDSALVAGSGAFGSLTTSSVGPPALYACNALKAALIKATREARAQGAIGARGASSASGASGASAAFDVVPTADGVVIGRKRVPWRDLFAYLVDDPIVVLGARGDDPHGFAFPPARLGHTINDVGIAVTQDRVASVQFADVEVDRLLGRIKVNRVVVVIDAGRVASPITARTNVIGAVMQGTSRALYEERKMDPRSGHMLSRNFETYAILGIADAPDVDVHFLPPHATHNPYGALGLGENSTIATCAAVANAFRAATGRRVLSTPMTPKRVLEVLA